MFKHGSMISDPALSDRSFHDAIEAVRSHERGKIKPLTPPSRWRKFDPTEPVFDKREPGWADNLTSELAQTRARIAELETLNATLISQNVALAGEQDMLRRENDALKEQLKEFTAQHSKPKSDPTDLNAEAW